MSFEPFIIAPVAEGVVTFSGVRNEEGFARTTDVRVAAARSFA
jgi:hypothetical protein